MELLSLCNIYNLHLNCHQ